MTAAAVGVLSPLVTVPLTVKGLIVTVIGGLGSIPGAIAAGLLVGGARERVPVLPGRQRARHVRAAAALRVPGVPSARDLRVGHRPGLIRASNGVLPRPRPAHRDPYPPRAVRVRPDAHRAALARPGRILRHRGLHRRHPHRHLRVAHPFRPARGGVHRGVLRVPRRLSRAAGQGPDAGGGDHRLQRVRPPVLLQPELARAARGHRGRTRQHQRLPGDPLLRGQRLVGMGDHDLRLGLRHPGHGPAVVDGPFARGGGAARGGGGRARRPERRHQPHRGEGDRR